MDNLELLQNTDYAKQLDDLQERCYKWHDICVQDVKYLCCKDIDLQIPIPAQSGGPDAGCRGELIPIPPTVRCNVILICADEHLKPTCDGVNIQVGLQVTLTPPNPQECPIMVVNHIEDFECTKFWTFPSGPEISGEQLRQALKMIDGSCMVIQDLQCRIEFGPKCATAHVVGKLIDKLWKNEDLCFKAFAPFHGITVKQEFPEPHKIGECTVPCPPIPALNDDPYKNGAVGSPCSKQK